MFKHCQYLSFLHTGNSLSENLVFLRSTLFCRLDNLGLCLKDLAFPTILQIFKVNQHKKEIDFMIFFFIFFYLKICWVSLVKFNILQVDTDFIFSQNRMNLVKARKIAHSINNS